MLFIRMGIKSMITMIGNTVAPLTNATMKMMRVVTVWTDVHVWMYQ